MATGEPPPTRLTLIGALRQGLRWEEFVALYGPVIVVRARHMGLQACDAENLCQEVLIRVWKGIASYDPARGRFRAWLYACTRNAVANLRRGRPRTEIVGSPVAQPENACRVLSSSAWLGAVDGPVDDAVRVLDEEGFAREDLQDAVSRVRASVQPTTWKAFLLFEFLEMTAKEIAPRLGLSPAAVNQAVYRVRQLLQQALTPAIPCAEEGQP